jgi:hypothetical protein
MTEGNDDSSNEPSKDSSSIHTGSLNSDIQSIVEAQRMAQELVRSEQIHSIIRAQKAVDEIINSGLTRDIILAHEAVNEMTGPALTREIVRMQEAVDKMVNPSTISTIIQTQKLVNKVVNPDILRSTIAIQNSLNSALIDLDATSISADIATISAIQHSHSDTRSTPTRQSNQSPHTDIDDIRPPESRIHDQLIWDEGEWYRDQTRQISIEIVDYLFWKAKQTGELTDASDEEISAGAIALAFLLTMILTGNMVASVTVAGATGGITKRGTKAAKTRTERKDLDDKFGDEN